MDTLINELTLYTKIDTNRIPYNFNTLSVNAYFDDCAEDLSIEIGVKECGLQVFQFTWKAASRSSRMPTD